MADMVQVLATGGTALVSAAAGAGLTYWLGALNRRHQEARENETRWYEQRFQAYVDFYRAENQLYWATKNKQTTRDFRRGEVRRLHGFLSVIDFVGSPEVRVEAGRVFDVVVEEQDKDAPFRGNEDVGLDALIAACRKDLGHFEAPEPP